MSKHKRNTLWLVVAAIALAILCVVPFVVNEYYVEILILFLINVLLAVSYRLITTTGIGPFATWC